MGATMARDDVKLGQLLGEGEGRDAIHIAIFPAIAAQILKPGEHVGIEDKGKGTVARVTPYVGIVDPFLPAPVMPGQRCFVCLYPYSITSLRHVWTHPAFPEEVTVVEVVKEVEHWVVRDDTAASEEWLRRWCESHDCPPYETVIAVIRDGRLPPGARGEADDWYGASYDADGLHFNGMDAHASIPYEFWEHVEVVLGRRVPHKPTYFSCSC